MTAEGVGGLLIRHLDATTRIAHTLNSLSLTAATNAATALIYATLTESTSGQKSYDRNALRDQIAVYIESRLNDPSLSIEEIAAAHHVSVRTLYRLFSDTGDTVSTYIRGRRLERSRADIIARPDLSIAEICMRWGVGEPKHFSRYYRARFGENPRETRMQARLASTRRPAVPDDVQADGSITGPQATTGTTLSCRPEPA
jgi:AraC-like DNA-binding protein